MNFCSKLFILISCFFTHSLRAQESVSPLIQIQVKGYSDCQIKLVGTAGEQNYVADTARLNATGQTELKGSYSPGLYYVMMPEGVHFQLLIVDNNPFSMQTEKGNFVNGMVLKGNPENELLYENLKYQITLEADFQAAGKTMKMGAAPEITAAAKQKQLELLAERDRKIADLKQNHANRFFTKYKLAGQNPKVSPVFKPNGTIDTALYAWQYRNAFLENTDWNDERLLNTPVIFNKLKKYIEDLTVQNPDSIIVSSDIIIQKVLNNKQLFKFTVNWLAQHYKPAITKLMDGEKVYAYLILKYWTPELAVWSDETEIQSLRQDAQKMTLSFVGLQGQDIWGRDRSGQKKSLYDLDANITILFIYNPDCEHCQEAVPHLKRIFEQYKSKGVHIFSLASMAEQEKWLSFGTKYGVDWTDVIDPKLESKYNDKYYVDITPEIYILDKNKKIIYKNLKANQLEAIFNEMIKL
jgi:thiol-disulfide isomerase/thioredoxin